MNFAPPRSRARRTPPGGQGVRARRRALGLAAAGVVVVAAIVIGGLATGGGDEPAGSVRVTPAAEPSVPATPVPATPAPDRGALLAVPGELEPAQRRVADQLVSVFENDTPEIQYGYVEVLGDGRGITAGRAGFCSGCGDMLEVVRRYAEVAPESDLVGFLPALRAAAAGDDADLDGLDDAWREAATDARFREVQDAAVEKFYFGPAAELSRSHGLRTALGVAVVYDTAIQHGTGTDHDSVRSIVARTDDEMGGTPADGIDEVSWLNAFLADRRAVLENPESAATAKAWGESTGRVDALARLLRQGELALAAPLVVNPWGTPHTLG
ncbi:MAG: chitosanase [Pseudonocardia sp.]|nr:chitosanase [Pseudonocardia sp.]